MTTTNATTAALEALIEAHAIELKLPTVRRRFRALAAEAAREQQTPVAYLAALLEAEHQERAERREKRRLIDARFPAIKRLEDFVFADNPNVPQATIAALAEGARPLHGARRHRRRTVESSRSLYVHSACCCRRCSLSGPSPRTRASSRRP